MNPRRPSPEDLKPAPVLDYRAVRPEFVRWLKEIRGLGPGSLDQKIGHLDKFARPIRGPADILDTFGGLNDSQKRHLANGLRSLFRFYEAQGLAEKQRLDMLRSNLPKLKSGVDFNVPTEQEIVDSLRRLADAKVDGRIFAGYNLLLDSGLRLVEGVGLYNGIASRTVRLEEHEGFGVAPLGEFRGTKLAYYGFVSSYTLGLIGEAGGPLVYGKAMERLSREHGAVSYKYLRKFAFDAMTSERLNVPESVADFIEGRTPKTVGARHYMQLRRKALQFYPRYARYVSQVKEKALRAH